MDYCIQTKAFIDAACSFPPNWGLMEQLLHDGVDINQISSDGFETVFTNILTWYGQYWEDIIKPNEKGIPYPTGIGFLYETKWLIPVLTFLLDHGADPNLPTPTTGALRALMFGANDDNCIAATELLIKHGADLMTANEDGENIYDLYATEEVISEQVYDEDNPKPGRPDFYSCICELMETYGAEPSKAEPITFQDIWQEARNIVAEGKDINATDIYGKTLLMHLLNTYLSSIPLRKRLIPLQQRSPEFVEALEWFAQNGAELNSPDDEFPLVIATRALDPFLTEWLLQHGADPYKEPYSREKDPIHNWYLDMIDIQVMDECLATEPDERIIRAGLPTAAILLKYGVRGCMYAFDINEETNEISLKGRVVKF